MGEYVTAVSHEHIDDGEDNGEEITVLVDKHTKVMYLQTEKYDNGVTVGLQVMVDKDGKPLVYNGNVN